MTRQRSGSRNAMFFRMLMRATMVKPGRVISALVAVVVAATVTTAMMNLQRTRAAVISGRKC